LTALNVRPATHGQASFDYLHLVRDLCGTLRQIHTLLAMGGLFVSKTPCVGDIYVHDEVGCRMATIR
jgi:hypothetical protein